MCGIVGVIGREDCVDAVLRGLRRLEYRGYDSGGIAALNGRGMIVRKLAGRLDNLANHLEENPLSGTVAIGHTRWATHGVPSDANAHPHTDAGGRLAIVHNGIIENHAELRAELVAAGHTFTSETDTEVLAHVIGVELTDGVDLATAVRRSLRRVRGAYAIAVVHQDEPDTIVAARQDSPLVVGYDTNGGGTAYVASDVCALLEHTRRVHFVADGEVVIARGGSIEIIDLDGRPIDVEPIDVDWTLEDAEMGGYSHFMLKEIYEQPRAVRETLRERVDAVSGAIHVLEEMGLAEEEVRSLERIVVLACGTSWHAALVGKFLIEEAARIPVDVEIASEYRYREHFANDHTLLLSVSQSGETADTLAALRSVTRTTGVRSIGLVNVVGSTIARESDGVLFTRAGPEIGVASTKAFTTQLTALAMMAIQFGQIRGVLDADEAARRGRALAALPELVEATLERADDYLETAGRFAAAHDFLFLGRGLNFPIALEGALKLKEISYIHAEGYPAGEMKHGPIALIDDNMPVVAIATEGSLREKVLSNIQEAAARGAQVIVVENDGATGLEGVPIAGRLVVPACDEFLSPIVNVIPLQLLAFRIAEMRGCDIDKPRNLAKSVTVE